MIHVDLLSIKFVVTGIVLFNTCLVSLGSYISPKYIESPDLFTTFLPLPPFLLRKGRGGLAEKTKG